MSASMSQGRQLIALAAESGEREVMTFAGSRGPYFGFNGIYVYLISDRSLWRSRSGLRTLLGGQPSVKRWALADCHAKVKDGRGLVLVTPEGESTVSLASAAEANQVQGLFAN